VNLKDERAALRNSVQLYRFVFISLAFSWCGVARAQSVAAPRATVAEAVLVDAPQPQPPAASPDSAPHQMVIPPLPPARRYAESIEPGQTAQSFTATEKLIFSLTLVARPITLLPALYSASYEQLFSTDPKYGHDAGAFGEKFGAAMLRTSSVRVLSNGVFAAAFHQDPRYYRIAHGSIIHRGLLSARQAIIRRGDDGVDQFNYSGIAGRAVAAALVTTYYPEPSVTARVVTLTFLTSIATDAGGNLVVEFLPNIIRKFPIMQKLRIE
jgi:hypothetical protein